MRAIRVSLLVLLASTGASAQQGPSSLEFSFSNPGARSLGFGGAFSGLADDATAAFANPAGLVQLARPEVSVEGRLWRYSVPFTEGGRISGEPTGLGLDTVPGLRTSRSEADLSGLSFLSYVYPKESWSLAFYRHVSAKFEATRFTQGFFRDEPGSVRMDDFRNLTDLEIVSTGVAGAYRLSERFSLGLGLVVFDADGRIVNERYVPLAVTLPNGPFGENVYAPGALDETADLEIGGSDVGFNFGFLWQTSPVWQIGGFFRQGPALDLDLETGVSGVLIDRFRQTIEMPDVYGLGAAYRAPGGRTTLTFEWDRVEYSTIIDSLDEQQAGTTGIVLEDADELRAGAEYAFVESRPLIAVRGGLFLDPDHRIEFVGNDPLTRAAFPGGEDELHWSLGIGIVFDRLQVDAAVDLSDLVDTASVSAIWTF